MGAKNSFVGKPDVWKRPDMRDPAVAPGIAGNAVGPRG
jgi:hypothetical protein